MATKAGLNGLVAFVAMSLAPALVACVAGSQFEMDMERLLVSRSPTFAQVLLHVEPKRPEVRWSPGPHAFRCNCGMSRLIWPERIVRLPDPVAALGAAFRKARAIKGSVLDPSVPVGDYVAGSFRDWVHDGTLLVQRVEIADETEMLVLFGLLAEAIDGYDDHPEILWLEAGEQEITLEEYRKATAFIPTMRFEFTGEPGAWVEIGLFNRRVLLQVGDKWDDFALDEAVGLELGKMLGFVDAKPR